jgi:hypothetical protein
MRVVMRWKMRTVVASALVLTLGLAACDRNSEDEQVAELEQQVSDLEAELEQTQAALEESDNANVALQQEVADLQTQVSDTEAELSSTQAELLDAQAQLAAVGELVLEDGTYTGQVLGAKASPYRVIIFDQGGLFRVAQVAEDATITSGGQDQTLAELGRLLASTDPDDAKLANGDYKVTVKNGLATSIRKVSG